MPPLTYDEWKVHGLNYKIADDVVEAMQRLHGIDALVEVESVLMQEYEIYMKGFNRDAM